MHKDSQASNLGSYMPTLDGWRAISIALVMLHHARISVHVPVFGPVLNQLGDWGASGVYVFFAISGVLICGRLLREEQKSGRIGLRKFYIRRAFRILPPALLYLAVIALLSSLLNVLRVEWIAALLFFRNYVVQGPPPAHWFTGHFWSLSVEEQFYLLLPSILVFFPRMRAWILGALTLVVVLLDLAMRHSSFGIAKFDLSIQCLLISALIAIAANREEKLFRRVLAPLPFVLIAVYVFGLYRPFTLLIAIQSVALALLVLSTSLNPTSLLGRFLELAPLRWMGRLSYSLYIWQQLFFVGHWWVGPLPLGLLQRWPLNLIACLTCAVASYYLIERPLVKLSHRIASSGVPGRSQDGVESAV